MAPRQFNKRGSSHINGAGTKEGVPGSRLPQRMLQEVKEQDIDDRKFKTKYVNAAANRKDLRKQKRQEKGKRKAEHYQAVKQQQHQHQQQQSKDDDPPAKRQKTEQTKPTQKVKATPQPVKSILKKAPKIIDEKKALEKLSKTNPQLYALLDSDNLLDNVDSSDKKGDFADDDRDIAYWEKKLKLGKNKSLGKAFQDDGLLDILGEGDGEENQAFEDDDKEYLRQKRAKAKQAQKISKLEEEAEEAMDDMFADLDRSDTEEDDDEDDDEENSEEGSDEDLVMDSDIEGFESDDDDGEKDDEDEDEDENENEDEEDQKISSDEEELEDKKEVSETSAKSAATKYIPPHLRKAANTKSEQQIRLHRLLQGLFNKLSESNLESILAEIEKTYSNYPRNDVTSTITEIILTSIAQKGNLLDSFVIIYATIVGSLYRLIGVDFAAHFVQTLIEAFEKNYNTCRQAIANNEDGGDEGPEGSKESKNLLTLTIELYNFQVISSVLIFDLVRLFISQLDEQSVEHLLKIIKVCGPQMRADDPAALKDIIDEIQKETAKRDAKTLSTRHKFMLETIANVKNNKIRGGATAAGQGDKDLVQKMKKYLNGIGKKRTIRSSEPLRVSLEDIHQIETKGKWWLVGASWKDNLVGTESKYASTKVPEDLKKDQTLQETLLKLARKQGMNTDVRRSIFITIMGAEDYLDAFENLLKLSLSEVQQREIARVLLQCTGNEKSFNPFYMLVSKRLCEYNHSYRVTFQYCLWDFLRDLGESGVGGLDRAASETPTVTDGKSVRLSRVVNVAKFYAYLIANNSLSLVILKSVNFMTLGHKARIFLETLFANIFLQCKEGGAQAVANVFGKIHEMRTLAQGCIFFIQESVISGKNSALTAEEMETVRWGAKIAREVLNK
ncbi:hypothetical protein J3Q64DRAFT_1848419 [Phycomyces blakesleeanus]|uniref:MI domain-containing protein n=1 Tax=Phycomyces blakesleeanus TaxID=4837 RepID=A0ABR3AZK0_PHYBL